MTKLVINADHKKSRIEREVYGHFSEHLGRCIYGGIYVGEDSDIPHVKGMRTDVVEAPKKSRFRFLGGREAVSLMNTIGRTASVPGKNGKR